MKEISVTVSFKYARTYYKKNVEDALKDYETYGGNVLENVYEKACAQLELFDFYKQHPIVKMLYLETYLELLHTFALYFSEVDTYNAGLDIEIGA